MNELKIFKNEKFGEIRIVIIDDKPYFNLKDVCTILGLEQVSRVKSRLKEDGVILSKVGVITGTKANGEPSIQNMPMNFIDEPNLYKCIFQSRKKEAEEFTDWVTSEVLPMIRKTGMYMTENVYEAIMQEPEKIGEILIQYGKAKKENEVLKMQNKVQEQQILELKPKALYYDLILQCKDLLSTTMIAKDYGMSAKAFNKLLHELKIQYNQSGIWFLYQKYAVYGYTQTKTNPITRSDGSIDGKPHMYWTQKGRIFLYNFLKEKDILPLIETNDDVA